MTWNPPSDVNTGDNLTSTLWNDQLGANGSLKYVYDNTVSRYLEVRKTTNTVFTANSNQIITFDDSTNVNFPFTPSGATITIPQTGAYCVSFLYRTTASTQFYFVVNNLSIAQPVINDVNTSNTSFPMTSTSLAYFTAGQTINCQIYVTTATTLYGSTGIYSSILRIGLLK